MAQGDDGGGLKPTLAVFATLALVWGGGAARLSGVPAAGQDNVRDVVLRLVQPNIEQSKKWRRDLRIGNLKELIAMSKTATAGIRRIQEQIASIDHVCSGHLQERMRVCGKSSCRCAKDPAARHGPYFIWSRRENGRLVQTNLTPKQATRFKRAIADWKRVQALLKRWEQKSALAIREDFDLNG